jgi:AcrR family transcriptional regulator
MTSDSAPPPPPGSGGPHAEGGSAFEPHAEALRDLVLEKLTEKASRYDRSEAKGRLKAEALDSIAERIDRLQLWTRVPPPGRKPRLSRDELATAAVRIADAEGLEALSMRRLATDLGVGTMTLYHYVQTKDEVLALALDTVMGEVVLPPDEPLPEDWREAMTVLARRSRDALRRHPWMVELHGSAPYGPSSVRHFDQSLAAVRNLDAPLEAKLDVVTTVDEFVFGYCQAERTGIIQDRTPELVDYIGVLLETGAYPELEDLVAEHGLEHLWDRLRANSTDEQRFDRNLARLLEGLAVTLA